MSGRPTAGSAALAELLKRPIAFHPVLAGISGSVSAALMLSQALYWARVIEDKQPERDGWFYKTQEDWKRETCLSRWEQESARALLRRRDFWDEKRRGQPARLWFHVDLEKLAIAVSRYAEKPHSRLRDDLNLQIEEKPLTITETTHETTAENLGRSAASSRPSVEKRAALPQQRRYAIIARLAARATEILRDAPRIDLGDLTELLKTWAAHNGISYFDGWPGAASPIEQAITIARQRCS